MKKAITVFLAFIVMTAMISCSDADVSTDGMYSPETENAVGSISSDLPESEKDGFTDSEYGSETENADSGISPKSEKDEFADVKYSLEAKNADRGISPDFPESGRYKPGCEFVFKVEIVTDVEFVPYLDGTRLNPDHSDPGVGGYKYYSFRMPDHSSTLELSSDPFYIDRYYYFDDLFCWVDYLSEKTVKAIEIEDGYFGVDPNDPNNAPSIRYSEKAEDIGYNIKLIKEEPLVRVNDHEQPPGGWYRKAKYITFEGVEYTLTISNGYVIWNDFSSYRYFRFDRAPTSYPDIITDSDRF